MEKWSLTGSICLRSRTSSCFAAFDVFLLIFLSAVVTYFHDVSSDIGSSDVSQHAFLCEQHESPSRLCRSSMLTMPLCCEAGNSVSFVSLWFNVHGILGVLLRESRNRTHENWIIQDALCYSRKVSGQRCHYSIVCGRRFSFSTDCDLSSISLMTRP